MSQVMSLSEAKARLSELVNDVVSTQDQVEITRNGKPVAVLISAAQMDAMQETIAILSDRQAVADTAEAKAEIARGEQGTSVEEMRAILRRRQDGAV